MDCRFRMDCTFSSVSGPKRVLKTCAVLRHSVSSDPPPRFAYVLSTIWISGNQERHVLQSLTRSLFGNSLTCVIEPIVVRTVLNVFVILSALLLNTFRVSFNDKIERILRSRVLVLFSPALSSNLSCNFRLQFCIPLLLVELLDELFELLRRNVKESLLHGFILLRLRGTGVILGLKTVKIWTVLPLFKLSQQVWG